MIWEWILGVILVGVVTSDIVDKVMELWKGLRMVETTLIPAAVFMRIIT